MGTSKVGGWPRKWFVGCDGVAEIKKVYRTLAMQWHPDRGGDTATMQEINVEYERVLKAQDGEVTIGDDGKEHTYRYDEATERAVAAKLAEVLRVRGDFDVLLIGTWIWAQGDTRPVKDQLSGLGFHFHGQRVAWYWCPPSQQGRYRWHKGQRGGLDSIAATYGARVWTQSMAGTEVAA